MPWKERGGRSYYYAAERAGRRVVYWYIGTGEVAWLFERRTLIERIRREMGRVERAALVDRLAEADGRLGAVVANGRALAEWALNRAGIYRHKRGEWRRRRGMSTKAIEPPKATPPVRPSALVRQAERLLINKVIPSAADGDALRAHDMIVVDIEGHAATLAGPDPSPIIRALAVVAAIGWWNWIVAEFCLVNCKTDTMDLRGRHAARCQKKYLSALRALHAVRKNLPESVVYQQINNTVNARRHEPRAKKGD